jgi:hypothetical protein
MLGAQEDANIKIIFYHILSKSIILQASKYPLFYTCIKIKAVAKQKDSSPAHPPKHQRKTKTSTPENLVEITKNSTVSWILMIITAKQVIIPSPDFLLTVTTIIKSTIGSGIIALPYTISTLGYIFSLILFVLFFALNQFASILLLKSKNLSKHSNYSTILHYIW